MRLEKKRGNAYGMHPRVVVVLAEKSLLKSTVLKTRPRFSFNVPSIKVTYFHIRRLDSMRTNGYNGQSENSLNDSDDLYSFEKKVRWVHVDIRLV